jgi:hypothetical protein
MEPQPVHSYHAARANVARPQQRATNRIALAWIEWLGHSALATKALLSAAPQPDSDLQPDSELQPDSGPGANSESHSNEYSSVPGQPPE